MATPREKKLAEQEQAVMKILSAPTSLPEQIDALAEVRGSYTPGGAADKLLDSYTAGQTSLADVLHQLADPIDDAYTSGHKAASDETSTEAQLWSLWFAILHAARKLTYSPGSAHGPQTPLVDLVAALVARPDPPRPDPLPVELEHDWIWASGHLWSTALLLGPSVREAWNDSPGAGTGLTDPEVTAWENVNAFVARLARDDIVGGETGTGLWKYGIHAMHDALEREHGPTEHGSAMEMLDVDVRVAAAWINMLGRELWAEALENEAEGEGDGEIVSVDTKPADLPFAKSMECTRSRWRFWREKFDTMVKDSKYEWETKEVAEAMAKLMSEIEQEAAHK